MPHRARVIADRQADRQAVRQLTLLILGGLASTLFIVAFLVFAAVQAVTMIDSNARDRETLQVARAVANASGSLNEITLAAMAQMLDLEGARLTTIEQIEAGELSVSLAPGSDRVVAWMPRLLGSETFAVVAPIRIAAGIGFVALVGALGWRVVIVARRLDRRRAAATRQAMTDALTGLGNRLAFDTGLETRRAAAAASGTAIVVALFDLDGFKEINDSFGHAAGDVVLQRVARDLRETAAPDDLVARIGGDEFAVIRSEEGLDAYLEAVRARLALPLQLGPRTIPIAASIGLARGADFLTSSASLVQAADSALYRAKRGGRGKSELAAAEGRVAA